jgi:hypothetical protein
MNESKRCGNEGEWEVPLSWHIADHAVVSLETKIDGSQHAFVYCYVCEQDFDADSDEALERLAQLHNELHMKEKRFGD